MHSSHSVANIHQDKIVGNDGQVGGLHQNEKDSNYEPFIYHIKPTLLGGCVRRVSNPTW